jgi:probable rRNA maturation factor
VTPRKRTPKRSPRMPSPRGSRGIRSVKKRTLKSSLRIALQLQAPDTDPPLTRWLPRQLRKLATLEGATRGQLTIAVVDNRTMAALHRRHMKIRGPTDVMTFDLRDSPRDELEGDIVISKDIAAREAKKRGHATRLEILLYALHGLLHLRGYDDHRATDYRKMHAREDDLLRAAGLGKVFARDKN